MWTSASPQLLSELECDASPEQACYGMRLTGVDGRVDATMYLLRNLAVIVECRIL